MELGQQAQIWCPKCSGGTSAPHTLVHDTTRSTPAGMAVSVTLPADESERFSSLALSLVLFLLITSFLTSYYLKVKRITAVHETIVGLFAGMFVGVMLRLGPLQPVREMLSFSNTIMLNVLLPPIILSSGYDLSQVRTSLEQRRTHMRLRARSTNVCDRPSFSGTLALS